jgi:hypothetical protein
MRESRTYGSVRGARGDSRPYRDRARFGSITSGNQCACIRSALPQSSDVSGAPFLGSSSPAQYPDHRPWQKKTPIFIDSKPTSENREGCLMTYAITWAEWRDARTHP